MQPFHRSKLIAFLIAGALLVQPALRAQEGSLPSEQTRPRRARDGALPPTTPPAPAQTETTRLSTEPVMRIGLATDVGSVNISTSGRLVSVTDETVAPATLAVSRVRVEARSLAPMLPPASAATSFRVEITGAATRVDAERAAGEISNRTGEASEIGFDVATNTWRIRTGEPGTRGRAEELRARLEDAGFANARVVEARSGANASTVQPPQTARIISQTSPTASLSSNTTVRPVSRASVPTRELVAYAAPGRSVLLSSRAPVTFASDDERNAPVRFNEKAYRGRLEVFASAGGALTVVNVVGLEDYVRGVVPNELSPGGYGAIEALKAQAVAARTYAVKNRNQFASQGFDLLPTTRSQVYGGLSTEHPLSTRAVDETRGMVATYRGEPINALYTSTCGGRTENVENIFNEATPYLRGRECAVEGRAHFAPFTVKSSREPPDIREEQNGALARDVAVLAVNDFPLNASSRVTDAWLASAASVAEVRNWLAAAARLSRQSAPQVAEDATRPPGFSTALVAAVYGPAYADTLLNDADVEYLLAARDAGDIPARNRADVALLLRDGHLSLSPEASLGARDGMTRARAIHTIAHLLESRGILQLQKGTTKPSVGGALILRSSTRGRDQPVSVTSDAYLFRALGEGVYQMRSVALVGGEPVTFHLNRGGQVDYLEVRPAANGAAADRFSPFTNWTVALTVAEARSRLSRWANRIGALTDLRIAARGWSRRVTDLEIVGTEGSNHLRGGRIRSALGLREQLFVIERRYDETGRVTGFQLTGRGWGHGVGLCQVGAYGMARAGLSYDKILKAYYTGIDVTKLY